MKYILSTILILFTLLGLSNDLCAQTVKGLSEVYDRGYWHLDTNNDGLSDKLNTYVILSDNYKQADVVAAANIAARLAFETTAMDMDIARFVSELSYPVEMPVIFVGSFNADENNSQEYLDLSPGQGIIEYFPPDSRFKSGRINISGYDATGLLTVSEYLAGRFPNIWGLEDSANVDLVNTAMEELLNNVEIQPETISVKQIVIDKSKAGISSLTLEIQATDSNQIPEIVRAISTELDKGNLSTDSKLIFKNIERIEVLVSGNTDEERLTLQSPRELEISSAKKISAEHAPDFNLSKLYTIEGLFKDTKGDYVPDYIGAYISYSGSETPKELISLAARLSLESAGLRIPLVQIAGKDSKPESKGFPILFGINHSFTEQLKESNKLYSPALSAGEGYVQFVDDKENERKLLVLDANDEEGLKSIAKYVSQTMPYLSTYGKGNFGLDDLETDTRRFYQGVKANGQTASAIEKLDKWLLRTDGNISKAEIEISAEKIPDGLDRYIENLVAKHASEAEINVISKASGFGVGDIIFQDSLDIPWEVDEVKRLFNSEVLPLLSEGDEVSMDIRVSESKEVRNKLQQEIIKDLEERNIQSNITVLSAFKQGYSWLEESILPKIKDQEISSIDVTFYNLLQSEEINWQSLNSETRWLQELYPIDLVLARELDIDDSQIQFKSTWTNDPIYKVEVIGNNGNLILEDSFSPTYSIRPFYDIYPKNDSVRVSTGLFKVERNEKVIVDQRVKTDLEYFWDYIQSNTYPKIESYIMNIQDGDPSPDLAPYFDEFEVNLFLSEPNYRIGLDEHTFSSLDGIHSDIYWQTLNLFSLIGNQYQVGSLLYAGRVIPYIHEREGKPGEAFIKFTGKEKGRPELKFTYLEPGNEEEKILRYKLPNLNVKDPSLRGIWTSGIDNNITRALFEIKTDVEKDQFETYKGRATESTIDRSYVSTERLARITNFYSELQQAGLFEQDLSYERIPELVMQFNVADSLYSKQIVSLVQPERPGSTVSPKLYDENFEYNGETIVQWDTPIPPDENNGILAKLNTFPEVNVYYMSKSLLGQNVFAADILPSQSSKYISQAKLNALKPTLFLSGREHGNEVSSTSYILRLLEYMATKSEYKKYLNRVNLVVQPLKNVDGAMLAYRMYQINKDFTNHAGYLGALGVNISSAISQNPKDPIYPEATVRRDLWKTWLPDVFMNLHGYPKNEWVQNFAGYSAWVRDRNITSRSWWAYRGWFMPGYRWIDDIDHPEYRTASLAVLDSITTSVSNVETMNDVNQRAYRTYRKYRKHEENYYEHFENGVLVYKSLKGVKIMDNGEYDSPKITYVRHTTESPDETAYGDWLKMIGETGIAHVSSVIKYLYYGENRIEESITEEDGYTLLNRYRIKPILPVKAKKEVNSDN